MVWMDAAQTTNSIAKPSEEDGYIRWVLIISRTLNARHRTVTALWPPEAARPHQWCLKNLPSRNFASCLLPSFGQEGYRTLPSWSRASVYAPATSAASPVPSRSPAPVTSTSSQLSGPSISNGTSSNSSKTTTPYTPDSMRIDALSRYKVNVPPETITAPSPKTYPGSAPQFIETSDRRFILPEPTVSTSRGRVAPDKPYSGPPPVIQSWTNVNLPIPDLNGASAQYSPEPSGGSPAQSPSIGHAKKHATPAATSRRYGNDSKSPSSCSGYYQSSPSSTSRSWPSHSFLYGYQGQPLPLPEQSDRRQGHEPTSESSSSGDSNYFVPGYTPKSAYRAENSNSLKLSGASLRDSRKLSDYQPSIGSPSSDSRSNTENPTYSADSVASLATAATSNGVMTSKLYPRATSSSIYNVQLVSYPESHTRFTDSRTSTPSASRSESAMGNETIVSAASGAQVHQPPILSVLSSSASSSASNTPKTPCVTQVPSSSSTSSANSTKSIHPVLSRLKSSESLQQRRSPGSNLSLSGLQKPNRSESIERNERDSMSPSAVPISDSSISASCKQNSINGKELSSQIHTVDDSCSNCGISASVLVEYAKGKEELVVKKKQWEAYFCEDQAEKAELKEKVEAIKEQGAKLQAEYEITRMDRDNLRMDCDNLKQKLDAQQKFINDLSQQLEAQREEIRRAEACLSSGGIHSAGLSLSIDSSAAVNSPPATTESVCSGFDTYDGRLNHKDSDAVMHDEVDAKSDMDMEVVHQMITRSRASKATNGDQLDISNSSVEIVEQPCELDHILNSSADPILFRRTMQFTSRSPFPVESAISESSSRNDSVISKAHLRPGRKMRPRLLFDGSNLKALHVHRGGKFGKIVTFAEEDDKPGPFGLEPKNAVPVLRDYILGFREGVIDPRTKRLKRGIPVLKVGRKIPGELLKS
ncbi:uncharacterized protein V1513DRAFT_138119 [Lipomyces chichibuensis]|uniref:uncharacterized protein n=1 Tax=Lipomyces chichibuensis TaxID=1546026 RepID=UPI0033434ACC